MTFYTFAVYAWNTEKCDFCVKNIFLLNKCNYVIINVIFYKKIANVVIWYTIKYIECIIKK